LINSGLYDALRCWRCCTRTLTSGLASSTAAAYRNRWVNDIAENADGIFRITRKVANDRIISTVCDARLP
jgi:hypothetical protein